MSDSLSYVRLRDGFNLDFDLLVNGLSLRAMVDNSQLASRFAVEQKAIDPYDVVTDFMGSSQASHGRMPLFVCPMCGDIGCGAVTLKVERQDYVIIWSDFRYQTSMSVEDTEHYYSQVGPFTFDIGQYKAVIESLLDEH